MKQCASCGKVMGDQELQCSCGHSTFVTPDKETRALMIANKAIEALEKRNKERRREAAEEFHKNLMPVAEGRGSPLFHGERPSVVHTDLAQLLVDAVGVSVYGHLQNETVGSVSNREYDSNSMFWCDALEKKLSHGMRVQLNRFYIMEWLPSAPGRYFTTQARSARQRANGYINPEQSEYLPLGKEEMVLGGVGSLRLGSKYLGPKEVYPLGATSNGISHQGIPIFLGEYEYHRVMQLLRKSGGCLANISGYLKIIPQEILPVKYGVQIPKFTLVVDNLEAIGNNDIRQRSTELLATIAVAFGEDAQLTNKQWSYCSFNPAYGLDHAIDWLKDYSLRYASNGNPVILADFDEHMQHFENQIEFPIADVLRGKIDRQKLVDYQQAFHFTFNVQGDVVMNNSQNFTHATFNNFGGQQFVGRFNNTIANLNASGNQEFGIALAELAQAVNNSQYLSDVDKREKAEVIQQLGEEVAKPQPNKSIVKALGDGLMTALKSIPDVMKAATALAPFLQNIIR